jgi:hypothetical protein
MLARLQLTVIVKTLAPNVRTGNVPSPTYATVRSGDEMEMEMHDRGPQHRSASRLQGRKLWPRHPSGSARTNGRTCSHMFPGKALELRILQLYIWTPCCQNAVEQCG